MIRASWYGSSVSDQTYQSRFRALRIVARLLEPRVIRRRVVHDEVGDHADPALVRLCDELAEVLDGAEVRVDLEEVRDVVAAVLERRLVHRQEPDAVDAEPFEVVELLDEAAEVAEAVVVPVEEAADMDLVENGPLEPQRIALEPLLRHGSSGHVRNRVPDVSCRDTARWPRVPRTARRTTFRYWLFWTRPEPGSGRVSRRHVPRSSAQPQHMRAARRQLHVVTADPPRVRLACEEILDAICRRESGRDRHHARALLRSPADRD